MQMPSPLQGKERISDIDVIRGFALLGILMVNMLLFKAPLFFQDISITQYQGLELASAWFIRLLFQGKFYATFSFLFGLGFFILMDRLSRKGLPVITVYLRRISLLLVMGIVHLLFWSGDILVTYALGGLILLLFKNLSLKAIKGWAIGFLVLGVILFGLAGLINDAASYFMGEEYTELMGQLYEQAMVVYKTGTFGELLLFRAINEIPGIFFAQFFWVPSVLGYFLFGLYSGKLGVFMNLPQYLPLLRKVRNWGFALGIPALVLYVLVVINVFPVHQVLKNGVLESVNHIASIFMAAGYISTLTLALQRASLRRFLSPLASAGRMALTNYLSQTAVCVLLFNSYGLALFGSISLTLGIVITLTIYLVQVALSYVWMKRFNYGPLEWLWRYFTYMERPPWQSSKTAAS